jgi:hypothetical protein
MFFCAPTMDLGTYLAVHSGPTWDNMFVHKININCGQNCQLSFCLHVTVVYLQVSAVGSVVC